MAEKNKPLQWQIIDECHVHCEDCGSVVLVHDMKGRKCNGCHESDKDERRMILAKAGSRAITTAAREFLCALRTHGRDGAAMPEIMEAGYRVLGGREKLGEIWAEELQKARGENLTELEAATWERSPKIISSLIELGMRFAAKADEGKQLDVSSLTEEELQGVLTGLLHDLVRDDPEFRRLAVSEAIKREPALWSVAAESAGVKTVDAVSVELAREEIEQEAFQE